MKDNKLLIKRNVKGFTLVEILVVLVLFAFIGIFVTNSVFLVLRSAQKSSSMIKVRDNLNFVSTVIERQIRSANQIPVCSSDDPSLIEYIDQNGTKSSFSCNNVEEGEGYVASGSARLNSDDVVITLCGFECSESKDGTPVVVVTIFAEDANLTNLLKGKASVQTEFILRNN